MPAPRIASDQAACAGREKSIKEWFQAFAQSSGITLHVENMYGENNHHIIESCFKGLARALRQAIDIDPRKADDIPSTKGVLGN